MCTPNSARLLDKTFNYVVNTFRDIHQYCACLLLRWQLQNFATRYFSPCQLCVKNVIENEKDREHISCYT